MTFGLWAGTVLVALALLAVTTVLGRNLIKLYFERKSGQVGSRFKSKMVNTFVALSLLPAVLLFFFAYGLINVSIEQWFSAPASQMLEYSKAIADQYYEETHQRARHNASRIALAVGAGAAVLPSPGAAVDHKLEDLRQNFALDDVRLFDTGGLQLAESGQRVGPPVVAGV